MIGTGPQDEHEKYEELCAVATPTDEDEDRTRVFQAALFMVAPEGLVMLHHRLARSPVHTYSPRASCLDGFRLIRH